MGQCFAGLSNTPRDQAEPSSTTGQQAGPSNPAVIQAGAAGNNNPRTFTLGVLRKATKKFNIKRQIGQGVSAIVYRGEFEEDGQSQLVAVKRLRPTERRNAEYDCEVEMLTRLSHDNIINLIGFCSHDEAKHFPFTAPTERIVVYELMPLRSLNHRLHERRAGEEVLDWGTRMRIAAGVAKGLSYLHHEVVPRVIFGDLKPTDVLLGPGYIPKLSDFGLAINIPPENETSIVQVNRAHLRMTNPYCDPEALLNGALSPRTDVYSFGMLLLEIITRILPRDKRLVRIVDYGRVTDPTNFVGLADQELNGNFPMVDLMKAMSLATLCIHNNPAARPEMGDVVRGMNNLTGEPNAEWPAEFNLAGLV